MGLIDSAINPDPPHTLKEGNLIKKGFNEELDKLKDMTQGNKEWISELELKERQRTGIKSLKVGYTSVFGYYIEISRSNLGSVPADYIRKQTLVNCERFVTPSLKEREALILNAEEKMFGMEYEIFVDVRGRVSLHTKELQNISEAISELDVLLSFAVVAAERKYSRPVLEEKGAIHIKGGRHPVVEATLGANMFVPNDTDMDPEESRFVLITGPNMAGKSTYMRQVSLICLMAQVGSFIPAASARLPMIDRIFTRIGAMDDIYAGQSTFMVEMTETANIINNATSRSLIILDEIGRGTSTFDGMSIAASVAEFIHNKIKAYTLFATHYHEITQLANKHPGMKNLNTLVKKEGDKVIFLHKIVEGTADQSYGIEVAKLAGLPDEVVSRAKEIYSTLEMVESGVAKSGKKKKIAKDQMGLF
jgi:DNA mismatch repair protein MutS